MHWILTPIIRFSLVLHFYEKDAMNIKEINENKMLQLIYMRYSVRVRIPCKENCDIISAIIKLLIAYFGTPGSILTDISKEFNNQSFRGTVQNLNIVVYTTTTESPWRNGLNEQHKWILEEIVKKTIEEFCGSTCMGYKY